jgi:hypothetical protein
MQNIYNKFARKTKLYLFCSRLEKTCTSRNAFFIEISSLQGEKAQSNCKRDLNCAPEYVTAPKRNAVG